jgi:glycosyltransferase involved in cell wall biosynthesis
VPGFDHFVYLRHDSNTWAFGCGLAWDAGDWQTVRVPPHLVPDIDFYLSISSRTTMPSPSLRVVHGRAPLVSCVMPTADRRRFVRQAIRGFLRQDYPNRELIIVDDGREKVGDLLPSDPRIRYVPLIGRVPLGLKRNLACEYARGSIIAHWDDDDWTADWRLSYQVESLLDGDGDLCGLTSLVFFDPRARQAWRYSYASSSPPWLAGATLCYTKAHWQATRFEEVDAGEDARFLAASAHARIVPLDDDRCYAALVHPGNTHVKRTSDVRYRPYPFEELAARLGGDLQEYAEDTAAQRGAAALPFISCIMPTRDRRVFVPQAIRCFLRQEHARRELIIVDDGVDRVGDLVPSDDRVRYLSLPAPLSLGEKRNIAVRESRGSIVAHWDDDDWYHPTYLSRVSARLESPPYPRAVNGLGTFLVWVVGDEDVRVCRSGGVAGGTIAYARDLWESRAYRDVTCGEDTFFLEDTRAVVQADHEAQSLYVLVRHGRNTWRSQNGSDVTVGMRRLPLHGRGIEEITGEDAGFYVRAEQALRQAAGLG